MHKVEVKIAKIAKIHAAAAIAGGHPMRACDLSLKRAAAHIPDPYTRLRSLQYSSHLR